MPYDVNRQDEDELRRQAAATAGAAQNPGSFSLAPGLSGPPPQAPSSAAPAQPSALGAAPVSRFVNFGRRFELNKGSAEQMAQGVGNKVEGEGSSAQNAFDKQKQDFMQQSKANELKFSDPGLKVHQPGEKQPAQMTNVERLQATQAPPGAITRDEVSARAGQTYGGPSGLDAMSGYADTLGTAKKAGADATALGTNGGIQAALGYTGSSGNSRLDSALTGVAGADQFGTLQKRYGGLADKITSANVDSKRAAEGYAANTANAAKQYSDYGANYDAQVAAAREAGKPPPPPPKQKLREAYDPGFLVGTDQSKNASIYDTGSDHGKLPKSFPAAGVDLRSNRGVMEGYFSSARDAGAMSDNPAAAPIVESYFMNGTGVDGSPVPDFGDVSTPAGKAAFHAWLRTQAQLVARMQGGQ